MFTIFQSIISVESEMIFFFLEKPIGKEIFNINSFYSLCITEETLTYIFPLFYGKNGTRIFPRRNFPRRTFPRRNFPRPGFSPPILKSIFCSLNVYLRMHIGT